MTATTITTVTPQSAQTEALALAHSLEAEAAVFKSFGQRGGTFCLEATEYQRFLTKLGQIAKQIVEASALAAS